MQHADVKKNSCPRHIYDMSLHHLNGQFFISRVFRLSAILALMETQLLAAAKGIVTDKQQCFHSIGVPQPRQHTGGSTAPTRKIKNLKNA